MEYENKFRVYFSAISQNESLARVMVTGFLTQYDPVISILNDVKTAVSEGVTNAIIHGYEQKGGEVELFCGYKDKVLYIEIADKGRGIDDIEKAVEPLFTSKPEQERSGMGFTIMETFMSKVSIESNKENGTRIYMEKNLSEEWGDVLDRIYELIQQGKDGNQEAKEILIKENSGLIWKIVRRFQGFGVDTEDLFQIGAIGLLKCIAKFDFSYEVKFSTYAVPMIIGEIRRFLRDDGTIKVSRSLKELATKAKKTRETMEQDLRREVTILELAKALSVTVEELVLALEAKKDVESLNAPLSQEEDTQIQDKLPSKENSDFVVNKLCLMEALKELEEKERKIIILRYFQDLTQTQIARKMGISQVQVSRIEKKVLERMRNKMSWLELLLNYYWITIKLVCNFHKNILQ